MNTVNTPRVQDDNSETIMLWGFFFFGWGQMGRGAQWQTEVPSPTHRHHPSLNPGGKKAFEKLIKKKLQKFCAVSEPFLDILTRDVRQHAIKKQGFV